MQSNDHARIKLGSSFPLVAGSSDYFQLLKEWLRVCDDGKCSPDAHHTCVSPSESGQLPTRLVDLCRLIPEEFGPDTVRLIEPTKTVEYTALSHCWGPSIREGTPVPRPWVTTSDNLDDRMKKGFSVVDLPDTFRDAIIVTRKLGKRYLWIDSLCIKQGDIKDWEAEAGKMQNVFRGAYCTIAATSATHSGEGFLNRQCFEYAHSDPENFKVDVLEGTLNQRAWVFQERALSRRIIHFTNRQTYWECGGGVRCETLTYMRK